MIAEHLSTYRILFDQEGPGDGGGSGAGSGEGGAGDGGGGQGGTLLKGDGGQSATGNGGEGTPDWRDSLPEDLKSHEALAKHDSLEGLARGFVNAQKVIGKDPNSLIEVPGQDAGFDSKREALTKLGAPKDADGYKIQAGENTPEFLSPEGDMAKGFTGKASELGLLPEQVQGLYAWFSETMGGAAQQSQQQTEQQVAENIQSLETEWGEAFDQKVAAADFAVEKLGGKELRDESNNSPMATNPKLLNALSRVGEMLKEDSAGSDTGGNSGFGDKITPNEAKSRADDLTRKANSLGFNDPERRRLNEEAARIRARARGEKLDI